MSESNKSRRKLLKSIAAGSGAVIAGKSLPESWSKPVVDSVMLPAHAQTSPSPCTPCLVAATYCGGGGSGSIDMDVAIDGTVTVTHSAMTNSSQTDTVDPCTGGAFSVSGPNSGNEIITVSGTIPCGTATLITVTQINTPPTGAPTTITVDLTTANCT